MRRRPVPVEIVPGQRINAWYTTVPEPHIEMTTGACGLSPTEIRAMVSHEIGHRELYHIERARVLQVSLWLVVIWLIFDAQLVEAIITFGVGAYALYLHNAVCELEADAYAAWRESWASVHAFFEALRVNQPDDFARPLMKIRSRIAKRLA